MNAYIYALTDPRTGGIRYVGKTTDPVRRWRRHLTEQGRTHRHYWLTQLSQEGLRPGMLILETVGPNGSWQAAEAWWIAFLQRQGEPLVNIAAGGNGAPGISPAMATRVRLSESVRRAWRLRPRTLSEAHAKRFGQARLGAICTEDHRRKISRALTGISRSEMTRQKIANAKRGIRSGPHSKSTKAKLRDQKRGERNPQAKLTREKAETIRARYAAGGVSLSQLAREYGVDAKQIHRIVRGEAWAA